MLFLVRSRQVRDDVDESAAAWGIDVADRDPEVFEIWPDNRETLELFVMLCGRQDVWRIGFDGSRIGLDYQQLSGLCAMLEIQITKCQAEDFREMAQAIVELRK